MFENINHKIKKLKRLILLYTSFLIFPRNKKQYRYVKLKNFGMLIRMYEIIGREIFIFRAYEEDETNFLLGEILDTDICADVGGNIGYFTLLMASRARNGQVHCFEPIALNSDLIRLNSTLNNMNNIIVNQIALSNKSGISTFSVSSDSAYSSLIATGRHPETALQTVETSTLDLYVANKSLSKIDILKIDVEGAELLVLDGAEKLLLNPNSRPRIIMIEIFDENLKVFGADSFQLFNKMEKFGYRNIKLNNSNHRNDKLKNVKNNYFFEPIQ